MDQATPADTALEIELIVDENKPEVAMDTRDQAGVSGAFTTTPISIAEDGEHTLHAGATEGTGNRASTQELVKLDTKTRNWRPARWPRTTASCAL